MRTILKQLMVRSSSDARRKYKITFYSSGKKRAQCSCPGWIYKHDDCKHIKAIKAATKAKAKAKVA